MTSNTHGGGSPLARIRAWDHAFIRAVANLDQRGPWRGSMLAATRAADGWGLAIIIPIALWIGGARGFAVVACGVISQGLAGLIIQGIKALFHRARPSGLDIEDPIGAPDKHAFPSGHTAQSFGIVVLAAWISPWFGLVLLPGAVLVAASRMFFGLHFPSDVIVGAVLGCLITAGTLVICNASGLFWWLMRISPIT